MNAAPWLKGLILEGIVAGVGAVLGFVPQIIEMGLDSESVDEAIWASMAGDIAADILRVINDNGITDHNHPRWRAYEAMLEAQQLVSE